MAIQADRVVKKAYCVLVFIGQDIDYQSQEGMLQPCTIYLGHIWSAACGSSCPTTEWLLNLLRQCTRGAAGIRWYDLMVG